MEELARLFADLSRERVARWWIGDRPSGPEGEIVDAIAMQAGLPTAKEDPKVLKRLCPLEFDDAAFVLARAGTTSLAYDRNAPSVDAVRRCKAALASLSQRPTFLTNGSWSDETDLSWNSLTAATFDCGVIGWDEKNAFVFWVEEED